MGKVVEHESCHRPESLPETVELSFGVCELHAEPLMDVLIEMLEEETSRVVHPGANALIHLLLQLAECIVNLF
jgi:hypothetical protein